MMPGCNRSYDEALAAPPVESPYFHYVIVRRDIPHGLQAAYIAHAAGESNPQCRKNMHVVVVTTCAAPTHHISSEKELEDIRARLVRACIPHHPMRESDGEFAGQLLSIGIEPNKKEVIRRHVSSLPLLK